MLALKSSAIPELDSWGTVIDLGSVILEGDAKAFGRFTHGSPDAPVSAGYFGVSQSKFRMVYPFTEHAIVLEGEVTLTNEATGETVSYKAGDGWTIEKGTSILWDVRTPRFVKHYLAVS